MEVLVIAKGSRGSRGYPGLEIGLPRAATPGYDKYVHWNIALLMDFEMNRPNGQQCLAKPDRQTDRQTICNSSSGTIHRTFARQDNDLENFEISKLRVM